MFVYVGTYTEPDRGGRGEGIYVYAADPASGALTHQQTLGGAPNPHFLALHPSRHNLYSTNGGDASAVSAFAIDDATGRLTALNRQLSPGPGPTHLQVDPSGRLLVAANYAGGSVAAYPIAADGSLGAHSSFHRHDGETGPNPTRQDRPHAHMAGFDASGRWVLICDLGLDRTFVYAVDAAHGTLTPADPPAAPSHPGAGPRHLAFHPDGRAVYVINELDATITVYGFDAAAGRLTQLQVVPNLPAGWQGENISAEVAVHPNGRFVYASNRGHDSIAIWRVADEAGRLALVDHISSGGRTPRHFDVAPGGRFLYAANQDSDNVVVFRLEDDGARPTPTGHVTSVGTPSCIVFR